MPSDLNNFLLPSSFACSTQANVWSHYAEDNDKSIVHRRGDQVDHDVFAYVAALCTEREFRPLMRALHMVRLLLLVGEENIATKLFKNSRHRMEDIGIEEKTGTLADIFRGQEAQPFIRDLEANARQAHLLLKRDRLALLFRTQAEREDKFHEDTYDVYGLPYDDNTTEYGPRSSFKKKPSSECGPEKHFDYIGGLLCNLKRGDACILKTPHRPKFMECAEDLKMWAGIHRP